MRDPLTLPESGDYFLDALVPAQVDANQPIKVAVSEDLGTLPIDSCVRSVIQSTAGVFSDLGAQVSQDHPNLTGAMEVFQTQRAAGLRTLGRSLDLAIPNWRDDAKDTAIWNIERSFALTADELLHAEQLRTKIYADTAAFFSTTMYWPCRRPKYHPCNRTSMG